MEQSKSGAPLNSLSYFDGKTTPIWKQERCFSLQCKVKEYEIQLNMDGDPHWFLMLKEDQQENWNLNTNGTKPTIKRVKSMLGLYLVFLMEFV